MDLYATRKRLSVSPSKPTDQGFLGIASHIVAASRSGLNGAGVFRNFASVLIILLVLVTLSFFYRNPQSDRVGYGSSFAVARVLDSKSQPLITSESLSMN